VDPDGREINNGDGTVTIVEGDTLWDIYGANWREESGYEGDPTKLQPGQVVGKKVCEVKQEDSNKGVDLNFFANNDIDGDIYGYAKLVNNPSDQFVIGGHGDRQSFADINYSDVTPEKLASLIKCNPNYKEGMDIKLLSCNLGGKMEGDNYAQQLANAMGPGVNIYAATEYCWFFSNGSVFVAGYSLISKTIPSLLFRRGEFKCFTAK